MTDIVSSVHGGWTTEDSLVHHQDRSSFTQTVIEQEKNTPSLEYMKNRIWVWVGSKDDRQGLFIFCVQ